MFLVISMNFGRSTGHGRLAASGATLDDDLAELALKRLKLSLAGFARAAALTFST